MGSAVIHSRTRASLVCTRPATAFRRSRSVRIPIKRPPSSTTEDPTPCSAIRSAASPSVSSGATVTISPVITSPILAMAPRIAEALPGCRIASTCKVIARWEMAENGYAKPVLVTTDWVEEHQGDEDVVVAEVDENPDLYDE